MAKNHKLVTIYEYKWLEYSNQVQEKAIIVKDTPLRYSMTETGECFYPSYRRFIEKNSVDMGIIIDCSFGAVYYTTVQDRVVALDKISEHIRNVKVASYLSSMEWALSKVHSYNDKMRELVEERIAEQNKKDSAENEEEIV